VEGHDFSRAENGRAKITPRRAARILPSAPDLPDVCGRARLQSLPCFCRSPERIRGGSRRVPQDAELEITPRIACPERSPSCEATRVSRTGAPPKSQSMQDCPRASSRPKPFYRRETGRRDSGSAPTLQDLADFDGGKRMPPSPTTPWNRARELHTGAGWQRTTSPLGEGNVFSLAYPFIKHDRKGTLAAPRRNQLKQKAKKMVLFANLYI
jgi:hypothetical protein